MNFREWLELDEAGFLSGLFGKSRAEREREDALEREEERKAALERQEAAKKAKAIADYEATLATLTGKSGGSSSKSPSTPYLTDAKWPQRSPESPRRSAESPLKELRGLIGGLEVFSRFLDRVESRSGGSLTDDKNRSDMYDVYYKISKSKIYKDDAPGLSEGGRMRAISIIEEMFDKDVKMVAFPEEEIVCPYRGGVDLDEYQLLDRGLFEKCAKVIVRGFRRGSQVLKARVTYSGMTQDERVRFWGSDRSSWPISDD